MSIDNIRRHSRPCSRNSRDSRALSWASVDSEDNEARALKCELNEIRQSLDNVRDHLIVQQCMVAREMEDRVRNVYDEVINDINEVRKRVNVIGDTFASPSKFKTWAPASPFRKELLQNIYEIRKPTKLKNSKSVDFVDVRDSDKIHEKHFKQTHYRNSWLGASNSSIDSRCSTRSKSSVPGYGCCFAGDNKTIPYRSFRARYGLHHRNPRHSWGPSRSGSRSTLDDYEDDDDDDDDDDKGPMCGVLTDDWRVKVAPYMWDGWPLPGLDKSDVEKSKERMEKFEAFRHESIIVQNEYRRQHESPDLVVSEKLSCDSQQWAEILAMKGYAQYSDSQSRGENILVVDIEDNLSGRQVMATWYREGKLYNYKQPKWQRGTSNFSQMIWKSSRYAGVGIAKFPHHDTYVIVVQYQPPGNTNTPGQFRKNVQVPKLDDHPEVRAHPNEMPASVVLRENESVQSGVTKEGVEDSLVETKSKQTIIDDIENATGADPKLITSEENDIDDENDLKTHLRKEIISEAEVNSQNNPKVSSTEHQKYSKIITSAENKIDDESELKKQISEEIHHGAEVKSSDTSNVGSTTEIQATGGLPSEKRITAADVKDLLTLLEQISQGDGHTKKTGEDMVQSDTLSSIEITGTEETSYNIVDTNSKLKQCHVTMTESSEEERRNDSLNKSVNVPGNRKRRPSIVTDV